MKTLIQICEYGSETFGSLAPGHLCHECRAKSNCLLINVKMIGDSLEGHRAIVMSCDLYDLLEEREISEI